jgi:hypothetical protein
MRHRHLNAVDLSGMVGRRHRAGGVGRDLVAEEIEVDPGIGAASLGAAEDIAVEPAGRGEIPNEEREVEGLGHRPVLMAAEWQLLQPSYNLTCTLLHFSYIFGEEAEDPIE